MTNLTHDTTGCDFCGQDLHANGHLSSSDMMISTTTYDADGDPAKTMETAPEGANQDYIVFCPDCTDIAVTEWNKLLSSLMDYGNGKTFLPLHTPEDKS